MKNYPEPHLLSFPKIGESAIGYISVSEFSKTLPFEVKRMFWTYYTPESVIRGRHAHFRTEQVLIAAAGKITVSLESRAGKKLLFTLENPDHGLYVPPDWWHSMQYSHSSVQLVLASTEFDEDDYIRDYQDFLTKKER